MVKKVTILIIFLLIGAIVSSPLAFTQNKAKSMEEEMKEVQERIEALRTITNLPVSDVTYATIAIKALYYQNIQIIELLEQMRDLLKQSLEKKE